MTRSRRELERQLDDIEQDSGESKNLAQAIADLGDRRREELADAFADRGVDDAEAEELAQEHFSKYQPAQELPDFIGDAEEYVDGVLPLDDGGDGA